MSEFYKQIVSDDCHHFSVIVEDDGRVSYAYLMFNGTILGDVWLYNQAENPSTTDFTNKHELPFLNPIEFLKDDVKILPILFEEEVEVKWIFLNNNCELQEAKIFIRSKLTAIVKPNSKPGWSMIVKKDGPLAKHLTND